VSLDVRIRTRDVVVVVEFATSSAAYAASASAASAKAFSSPARIVFENSIVCVLLSARSTSVELEIGELEMGPAAAVRAKRRRESACISAGLVDGLVDMDEGGGMRRFKSKFFTYLGRKTTHINVSMRLGQWDKNSYLGSSFSGLRAEEACKSPPLPYFGSL
jgi:hypothetical protein